MGAEPVGTGLQEPQAATPPATGLQEAPMMSAQDNSAAARQWWDSQHQAYQRIWNSDESVPGKLWDMLRQSAQTRPDAEQRKIEAQVRVGLRPPNEGWAALDQVESSPGAALLYGAANLLGSSDRQANLAADLGAATGGLAMSGSALSGRAPLYTGAQRPSQSPSPAPPAQGLARHGALPGLDRIGPSMEDFDSLVAEHSKGNPAPLTRPGAQAIFAQTQPPWTTAHVAGDNVAWPDILYRDLAGVEPPGVHTEVKAVKNTDRFDDRVKDALDKNAPVIAVQVPRGTDADRVMGKLRSNYSNWDLSGRSITVVDEDGKVLIGKQPFPQQRKKAP